MNIAKLLKSFNMPATFHSYKGCLYLGSIRFESFHSLPMLPWIVAEVRRAKGGQPHQVSIEVGRPRIITRVRFEKLNSTIKICQLFTLIASLKSEQCAY